MKLGLWAFLVVGFFVGFAATVSNNSKKTISNPMHENFDFLYGQWELLNAQELSARSPASLDDKSLNFVFEEDIYLDSNASVADASCESGVDFIKFSRSEQREFLSRAKKLPLLRSHFSQNNRDGIWSGEVVCRESKKPLWSAILMSRRQLYLVSKQHVVELYRRDNPTPIRETFTDQESEITTE